MSGIRCDSIVYNDTVAIEKNYLPWDSNAISFGLYDNELNLEQTGKIVCVNENEPLKKYLNITSFFDEERTYMLMQFIDYKLTNITIDGTEYENYPIIFSKNDSLDIPITFPGLSDGSHKIIITAVKNPFSRQEPQNNILHMFVVAQFDVEVSENKEMINMHTTTVKSSKTSEISSNKPYFPSHKDPDIVLTETKNKGENIDLIFNIPNHRNYECNAYVIALKDWKQVEWNDNTTIGQITLPANSTSEVSVNMDLAKNESCEITLLVFYEPLNKGEIEVGIGNRLNIR